MQQFLSLIFLIVLFTIYYQLCTIGAFQQPDNKTSDVLNPGIFEEKEEPKKTVNHSDKKVKNAVRRSNGKVKQTFESSNREPIKGNGYFNEKSNKIANYSVDWHYITDGSDGKFMIYVDINSFRSTNNIVTFWQKWVYKEDQKVTTGGDAKYKPGMYREERKKTVVDCWNMESGIIFEAYYTENNEFIRGSTYENPVFTPDIPDSFSYEIAEFVCGKAVPELTN